MVDVWLEVEAHQLHPAAGAIVMQYLITPLIGGEQDQAIVDENASKLRAMFEIYEARLSWSSAADLSHFPLMRYFMATEYAAMVEALPHVRAWCEDLAAWPAARKVAELMPLDFGLSKKDEK
ncbi:hypothetical protein SETIT_5G009200v2 [Setaria italica]|uniref:glutathione transferase n=1 Tax=Setaria italica TaxID=4555 RepID=A0A368QZV4_SETIT|nr:hypothetical protein SETIT_5G009200v2 [Setaria italica]